MTEEVENTNIEETKQESKQKKGRIFVSNLPFDINSRILRNLFKKFGEIIDVNIPINPANGRSKGFAFVELSNKNNSLKAIHELHGKPFLGRELGLKLAVDQRLYVKEEKQPVEEKPEEEKEKIEKPKKEKTIDPEIEKQQVEEKKEENPKQENKLKQKKGSEEELKRTVFVMNLDFDLTEEEIKSHFKKFGPIYSIKVF